MSEMEDPDKKIRFSCSTCGRCCGRSPHATIYDVFELADEFIFQAAHHVVLSYAKNPPQREILEHLQFIGHTVMMPELEASLFYFIDFATISPPSYGSCPKLNAEGACSIYAKRPMQCKLAPFDFRFPISEQWRQLESYRLNSERIEWKCDFSDQSPIVFDENGIRQPNVLSDFRHSVEMTRAFTDQYVEFISLASPERKNEHFKALFHSIKNNSLMITDMIIPLQASIRNDVITYDFAKSFIDSQIRLIDSEIEKSSMKKFKQNLQTTRLYKKQKELYVKAVANGIFDRKTHFDLY